MESTLYYQTCEYSWAPLLPRCWFLDCIFPRNSGSWCHHCPQQHKACPPILPPPHCSSCSTCWQWLSMYYSGKWKEKNVITNSTKEIKVSTETCPADTFTRHVVSPTWGSYFSTVAKWEELSYPPTAYRLPSERFYICINILLNNMGHI